ncbi:MAG: PH domain-containing protein [Hyphomonadaceae bacterium]
MAQYVDQSLAENETIEMRGRWPLVFWLAAWAVLLLLGVFVVGVIIFAIAAIHMLTTEFAVTDQRVILKRGLIARDTQELAVSSVEGVQLEQSIIGRIFGYGRLIVTGTGEARIVFPPMAEPIEFRRAIENGRSAAHEARRPEPEPA